jgi:hypothetical protein
MFRATKEFIAARQKHTKYKITTPQVRRIGGGEVSQCFSNAIKVVKKGKEEGVQYVALSGWLVQPYDKENNCTAIIQHWWNGDPLGNQFDTTPFVRDDEEYVSDFALYEFGRTNYERIKSNVTKSLLYKGGKFSLLEDEDNMLFVPINELRTDVFFKYEFK